MGAMSQTGSCVARTPPPPYDAAIFTSRLRPEHEGGTHGLGITVSHWESRKAISAWKAEE